MKAVPTGLQALLDGETARLCYLLRVTPVGEPQSCFTDADFDLTVDGKLHAHTTGFDCTSIQVQSQTQGSSVEITLFLSPTDVASEISPYTRSQILSGMIDQAVFEVYACDYTRPDVGSLIIYKGKIGQITFEDSLTATLQVGSLLDQYVVLCPDKVSYLCRADFGDSRCKVDLSAVKKTFTVTASPDGQYISTDLTDAAKYWDAGLVVFTSGENDGYPVEIGSYTQVNGAVVLKLPAPFDIHPGDTADIYPGCDKSLDGGCARWNNVLNFRGEPLSLSPFTGTQKLPSSLPTPSNYKARYKSGNYDQSGFHFQFGF